GAWLQKESDHVRIDCSFQLNAEEEKFISHSQENHIVRPNWPRATEEKKALCRIIANNELTNILDELKVSLQESKDKLTTADEASIYTAYKIVNIACSVFSEKKYTVNREFANKFEEKLSLMRETLALLRTLE